MTIDNAEVNLTQPLIIGRHLTPKINDSVRLNHGLLANQAQQMNTGAAFSHTAISMLDS